MQDNNTSNKVVEAVKKQAETLANNYSDSTDDIKLFLKQLISDRASANIELSKKVSALIYERRGFILEFTGAAGYNT